MRREGAEASRLRQGDVNALHAAGAAMGFVPEAGAFLVLGKFHPPEFVRRAAGEPFQCIKIAPILPDADMIEAPQEDLVAQQPVRFERVLLAADAVAAPVAALREQGVAYVRFSMAHPALFRLMFGAAKPKEAALDAVAMAPIRYWRGGSLTLCRPMRQRRRRLPHGRWCMGWHR